MNRSVVLAILVVSLGLLGLGSSPRQPSAPSQEDARGIASTIKTLPDGTKYLLHPSQLRSGGPGMGGIGQGEGIPALVDPPFVPAARADSLPDTELVLGLVWKGEARAYPFRILVWHEVVNDVVQGDPLLVTWCPLCFTGLAFEGRVEGKRELFGVSGKLYQSQLVLYDQTTESYWLQSLGKVVVGTRTGMTLVKVPIDVAEWGSWRRAHPETKVLSQDTGFIRDYGQNPYGTSGDFSDIRFRLGVSDPDARLPAQTIVHGVEIDHTYKAYPDHVVRQQEVINDHIEGTPVVVFLHPGVGGPRVFVRRVQDRTLTFDKHSSQLVDRETGSTWSAAGIANDGRLQGARLKRLVHEPAFWFAWSTFHPETEVYTR